MVKHLNIAIVYTQQDANLKNNVYINNISNETEDSSFLGQ
jgi:hypothetical protein